MTIAEKFITIAKWYKRYDSVAYPEDCVTPIEHENFTIHDNLNFMFYMKDKNIILFIGTESKQLHLTQIREHYLNMVDVLVCECMKELKTCLVHITVLNGTLSVNTYPTTGWNQQLVVDVNVRSLNCGHIEHMPVDLFTSAVSIIRELIRKHYSTDIAPNGPRKVFAFELQQDGIIKVDTFIDAYWRTDNREWSDINRYINYKAGNAYPILMDIFREVKNNNIRLVQWGWLIQVEWGKIVHNDGDLEHGNDYYASPTYDTHVVAKEYADSVIKHAKTLPHRTTYCKKY